MGIRKNATTVAIIIKFVKNSFFVLYAVIKPSIKATRKVTKM